MGVVCCVTEPPMLMKICLRWIIRGRHVVLVDVMFAAFRPRSLPLCPGSYSNRRQNQTNRNLNKLSFSLGLTISNVFSIEKRLDQLNTPQRWNVTKHIYKYFCWACPFSHYNYCSFFFNPLRLFDNFSYKSLCRMHAAKPKHWFW